MPLEITQGGTSQSTAPGARKALGLEIGVTIQPFDADLSAISALTTTGFAVRTAANTWTTRTLQQPAAGFTITNPAGVAGDPTFVLANDLGAIEALNTNAILARTGTDTWAARTITGTANEITVSNGSGVAGDPTISIPAALTFTGKTITGGTYSSPTINSPVLTLTQSTSPTPTAEGRVEWDTDDNWLIIGDGAASQTFTPSSPIQTNSPSGAATSDFQNLTSAYFVYIFEYDLIPSTDGVNLQVRVEVASAFATTSYQWGRFSTTVGSAASFSSSASDTSILIGSAAGNQATEGFKGRLFLTNASNATGLKMITWVQGELNTSTTLVVSHGSGVYGGSAGAITGIRFMASSGNISGTIKMYGRKS